MNTAGPEQPEPSPTDGSAAHAPLGDVPLDVERLTIERARTDRAEFGKLYDVHARAVLTYLLRRTGDRHASEDLTSEVFLRALAAFDGYQQRGVPFRHWLLRIATNLVANWQRTLRRRRVLELDEESEPRTPAALHASDEFDHVRAALDALPTRLSTVLALHYIEGIEVDALARLFACPPATVRTRLHRGRERLRRILERNAARHGSH